MTIQSSFATARPHEASAARAKSRATSAGPVASIHPLNAALATYRRSFEAALDGVELRRGVTPAVMSSIVLAFLQGAAVQIIREPENFDPTAALAEMRAMLG